MINFIWLSYAVNIVVLLPICFLLLQNNPRMIAVYGNDTTARQILSAMYLALLALSSYCLMSQNGERLVAWSILGFQVIYKLLSLLFIRDRRLPVYWFNFAIAILHSATLCLNPPN